MKIHTNKLLILWIVYVAIFYLLPWWNRVYFLWDDIEFLMRLRSPSPAEFFVTHQYQFQPLFYAVYWLEIHLFGVNPQPFFFVSVVVHLLNIYLVHKIIYRLTNSAFASLAAAVLVSFNKSYYTVIFWHSIFSNQLLVTFLLVATLAFMKLEKDYHRFPVIILGMALLSAGFIQGFGVGAGLVFAAIICLFWRKKTWWKPVFLTCAAAGLISAAATLIFSIPEVQLDRKFELSPQRIFNLGYFTSVGTSQAVISRFFLPGFIPNIYSPANIVIMITLPAIVLLFFTWVIIKNIKNYAGLATLFLFGGYTVIPYFIAGLARSGPGALGGLAERYIYTPFFFFILTLTYAVFLCRNRIPSRIRKRRFLLKTILIGAVAILSIGQQAVMHLEVYHVIPK